MKKIIGLLMGMVLGILAFGTFLMVSADEAEPTSAIADITDGEIGMAEATDIALKDAGLAQDAVIFSKKTNEFDDGKFVYDIDFLIWGETKYDYKIDAMDGKILENDKDPWEADDDKDYKGLDTAGQDYYVSASKDTITALEEAYQTALKDAGVSEADIILKQYGVNFEDGDVILDCSFMIPGTTKYDYDVVLKNGKIQDSDKDKWEAEDDVEYKNLLAVAK